MNIFFNPFSDLPEIPFSPDIPPEEHVRAGCISILLAFLVIVLAIGLCALFGSCKPTERIITVPEIHNNHHWHTDTLHQTDSTIIERETIVREADSATLASYGIALKDARRAWLIQTRELERQLQRLREASATRDTVRDTIPIPYPVEKQVPALLTWWQKVRIYLGTIIIFALFFLGIIKMFLTFKH